MVLFFYIKKQYFYQHLLECHYSAPALQIITPNKRGKKHLMAEIQEHSMLTEVF